MPSIMESIRDFRKYYKIDRDSRNISGEVMGRRRALSTGIKRVMVEDRRFAREQFWRDCDEDRISRTIVDGITGFAHDHIPWIRKEFSSIHRERAGRRLRRRELAWIGALPADLAVQRPYRYREPDRLARMARDTSDGTHSNCVACGMSVGDFQYAYLLACRCRMHKSCHDYLPETTGHYVCENHSHLLTPRSAPSDDWQSSRILNDVEVPKSYNKAPWRIRYWEIHPEAMGTVPHVWGPATQDAHYASIPPTASKEERTAKWVESSSGEVDQTTSQPGLSEEQTTLSTVVNPSLPGEDNIPPASELASSHASMTSSERQRYNKTAAMKNEHDHEKIEGNVRASLPLARGSSSSKLPASDPTDHHASQGTKSFVYEPSDCQPFAICEPSEMNVLGQAQGLFTIIEPFLPPLELSLPFFGGDGTSDEADHSMTGLLQTATQNQYLNDPFMHVGSSPQEKSSPLDLRTQSFLSNQEPADVGDLRGGCNGSLRSFLKALKSKRGNTSQSGQRSTIFSNSNRSADNLVGSGASTRSEDSNLEPFPPLRDISGDDEQDEQNAPHLYFTRNSQRTQRGDDSVQSTFRTFYSPQNSYKKNEIPQNQPRVKIPKRLTGHMRHFRGLFSFDEQPEPSNMFRREAYNRKQSSRVNNQSKDVSQNYSEHLEDVYDEQIPLLRKEFNNPGGSSSGADRRQVSRKDRSELNTRKATLKVQSDGAVKVNGLKPNVLISEVQATPIPGRKAYGMRFNQHKEQESVDRGPYRHWSQSKRGSDLFDNGGDDQLRVLTPTEDQPSRMSDAPSRLFGQQSQSRNLGNESEHWRARVRELSLSSPTFQCASARLRWSHQDRKKSLENIRKDNSQASDVDSDSEINHLEEA